MQKTLAYEREEFKKNNPYYKNLVLLAELGYSFIDKKGVSYRRVND